MAARTSALLDPETMSDQDLTDLAAIPEAPLDPLIPADGEWTRVSMRRFLEAQPKRMVHIPRDPGDKQGIAVYHRVIYQGFNYPILKGRSVEVPEPIALIVDELDKEFRTSQAQNRASFMHDVMSDEGAMLPLGQGTDR